MISLDVINNDNCSFVLIKYQLILFAADGIELPIQKSSTQVLDIFEREMQRNYLFSLKHPSMNQSASVDYIRNRYPAASSSV
jgi:hypothetical protein